MQVSSSNNYQAMNVYQKPENSIQPVRPEPENSIQPISPEQPTETVELTPEKQLEQDREAQAAKDAEAAEIQATNDARKEAGAQQVHRQSTKSQVEIYMAVATNDESSHFNETASILETLRDVQKQNNTVEAYATYQENQKSQNALVGTY